MTNFKNNIFQDLAVLTTLEKDFSTTSVPNSDSSNNLSYKQDWQNLLSRFSEEPLEIPTADSLNLIKTFNNQAVNAITISDILSSDSTVSHTLSSQTVHIIDSIVTNQSVPTTLNMLFNHLANSTENKVIDSFIPNSNSDIGVIKNILNSIHVANTHQILNMLELSPIL